MAGATIQPFANISGLQPQSGDLAQIQIARAALRLLDSEITRTELRLRALPAFTPMGGQIINTTAESRLAARSAPQKMGLNKNLVPIKMGKQGIGLNPAFMKFGSKGVTGMLAFHIVAGIGEQVIETGRQMREAEQAGAGVAEQVTIPIRSLGKMAARITGAPALAETLLTPGLGEKRAAHEVEEVLDSWFGSPSLRRAREAKFQQAFRNSNDRALRNYGNSLAFLDAWTPEDFDVYGDTDRKILREEIKSKNRDYLERFLDLEAQNEFDAIADAYRGE